MSWQALLGRRVQSVKILACPESASSAVARDFWSRHYPVVKHMHPDLRFMLRPAHKLEPYMMVEYDFGHKAKVSLAGLDEAGIVKKMEEAVQVGAEMPRSPFQSGPFLQPSVIE